MKIDFETAHDILTVEPDCILLDVREEEEYLTGHAIDAVLLPLDTISEETAAEIIPEKDTPVIVYCRTGRRSARAAEILEDLGYTRVYDTGGLVGWPYGIE